MHLNALLNDTPSSFGETTGIVDRQKHIAVPLGDPGTTKISIDPSKPCFFSNQPGCDLRHFETEWLCLSDQFSKSPQGLSWLIQ
jgi:hypothetical protein